MRLYLCATLALAGSILGSCCCCDSEPDDASFSERHVPAPVQRDESDAPAVDGTRGHDIATPGSTERTVSGENPLRVERFMREGHSSCWAASAEIAMYYIG